MKVELILSANTCALAVGTQINGGAGFCVRWTTVCRIRGSACPRRLGGWYSHWLVICDGEERYSINEQVALVTMAQWIEHRPVNQRVTGLIPSQGACLGCGLGPQSGACKRQPHTHVSLLLSLSLPSPH